MLAQPLRKELSAIRTALFMKPVNILLILVPVGILCGALKIEPTIIFILNFLAIVPLAYLLSFATEEIADRLGHVAGGLLNATFGNAVELIVSHLFSQCSRIS